MPQLEIQWVDDFYSYCLGGDRDEDADWTLLSPKDTDRFRQWWEERGIEIPFEEDGVEGYTKIDITPKHVTQLTEAFPDNGPGQELRPRRRLP